MPCSDLGKGGSIWILRLGMLSTMGEVKAAKAGNNCSYVIPSQEEESHGGLCSAQFHPFPHSRAPGTAMPSFRVTLPTSSKLTKVRHAQGFPLTSASWACLEDCLLDDSRPSQADSGYQPPQAPRLTCRLPQPCDSAIAHPHLGFLKLHPHTEKGKSFHFIFKNYLSSV